MRLNEMVRPLFPIVDDRCFGIEVELERVLSLPEELEGAACRWGMTMDGSLRNNGREFLSATPFTMDEVRTQVPLLYEWIERYRWQNNVRCSTHVHANVLPFTYPQIAAVCTVYSLMEPALFRLCGPLREENIYCVPWYRASNELSIVRTIAAGSMRDIGRACKYSALYLEPLVRFGTLEFRQAPVFDSPSELIRWVEIVDAIVHSGYDKPEDVMEAWYSTSPEAFMRSVLGSTLYAYMRDASSYELMELIDDYDVETTAEQSCCTYNEIESGQEWVPLLSGIESEFVPGGMTGRMYDFDLPTFEQLDALRTRLNLTPRGE